MTNKQNDERTLWDLLYAFVFFIATFAVVFPANAGAPVLSTNNGTGTPSSGQHLMQDSFPIVPPADWTGNMVPWNTISITNPSFTLTRPNNTKTYVIGDFISNDPISIQSFSTILGGGEIPRLHLVTNAPSGWAGVSVLIHLWSAPPTFTTGDETPYAPATGAANFLGTYIIWLDQFGDGAAGSGALQGISCSNTLALRLAANTPVYGTMKILSQAPAFPNQTFTITAEVKN